jgi:outer membrane protein
MKHVLAALCAAAGLALVPTAVSGQSPTGTFPKPQWFHEVVRRPDTPTQIPGPDHLRDHVVDGKLRLTLEQAIQLAIANDTDVRIDELSYQAARYNILRAYGVFDPLLTATYGLSSNTEPTLSQLSGATTLNTASENTDVNYAQLFQTGTTFSADFATGRTSDNDSFDFINPYITSVLTLTVTQPLLKNRGFFPNRAPILIAQRNLQQSRASFEAQLNGIIQQVVNDYWNVVFARENLLVIQKSVDQAQATYDHNKKELELGALSPLDIYRPEADVAARRVQAIQAEYSLKDAEDALREILAADLDPSVGLMDLDLIEPAEPSGTLLTTDADQAIQTAMAKRPELEALRQQMGIDDINLRLAHNELQPSLNLQGFYSSNGLSGNQLNNNVTPPVVTSYGGLGSALGQIGNFKYPYYGFTLTLSLPVRNRAAEADLATDQINKRHDLYNVRGQEQNIRLQAKNAVHELEQAKLSMAAAKIERNLQEKNLEAEQRKYDLGTETIFFVLDAQTELATAEVDLVQAQISYQRALADLDYATGELLEKNHVQIHDPK